MTIVTISTRDLSGLPDIQELKSLSQSLAVLDAIFCPLLAFRYYFFDAIWTTDVALASMRNGQGDHYDCAFTINGAILKGFAHEAPMSPYQRRSSRIWPGVLDSVPESLRDVLSDPALIVDETTFCVWRLAEDAGWQRGDIQFPDAPDPDGSARLLSILDGNSQRYKDFAETYYEESVSLEAVTHIYQHRPLTGEVIRALNPDLSIRDLASDLDEIGYPAHT